FVAIVTVVSYAFAAALEELETARHELDARVRARTEALARAEEQARQNETRLQLAMTVGGVASWDLDLVTGRNLWSDTHFHVLGLSPTPDRVATEEMWRSGVVKDDLPRLLAEWKRAEVARDIFRSEHRIVRADGKVIWVDAAGRFFYDEHGRAVRFIGIFFDVTERRTTATQLAELALALERERARLAVALMAAKMGVYEWAAGRSEVWWSPETYLVFGVDPTTFRPTVETFNALIHPEDREELWQKMNESVERGEPFEHEYRVECPDGRLRWIANRSQPSRDGEGGQRFTGVSVDVTERKQLELELREAGKRKDEFLATLAHELRNPLAPLCNALQTLPRSGFDAQATKRAHETMQRHLDQVVRLLDDLLDVSRISRGKLVLQRQTLSVSEVLAQAVEATQPAIDARRHMLSVHLSERALLVDGDRARLVQVFSNLLHNAARYTPEGGAIGVSLREDGGQIVVEVKDDGIGIPPSMLERVFELFAQVDRASERTNGGLGIGLSLVKRFVELHGGTVSASSGGENQGSQFVVRLPVAKGKTMGMPATVPSKPAAAAAARRKVLVVDDNVDAAETLAELISLLGHEVRTAFGGLQGVSLAREFEPELVLMDLGMPQLDGFEACRRIRQESWGEKIVMVAQSGWGQENDKRKTQSAGFDLHLVKPIDVSRLERLLVELPTSLGDR
ncbi:MAG: PAS domain-containing protein, partial [Archangium sp.]|nr:PAS domain-containing protein [Archangium sp.]